MNKLRFNEIDLVSGGKCLYRGMTDDGIDIYEDCNNYIGYTGMFGLGIAIVSGGIGLLVTSLASCCGSGYKALDRLESAIAGEICCFPRYTSRLLFSGLGGITGTMCLGIVSLSGGALTIALGGLHYGQICVPCTK